MTDEKRPSKTTSSSQQIPRMAHAFNIDRLSSLSSMGPIMSNIPSTNSFTYEKFSELVPPNSGKWKWLLLSQTDQGQIACSKLRCCTLIEFLTGNLDEYDKVVAIYATDYQDLLANKAFSSYAPRGNDFLYDSTGKANPDAPYSIEDFKLHSDGNDIDCVYTGNLPDCVTEQLAYRELLGNIVSYAYIRAFGASDRYDLPDPEMDPMPILSRGREAMPWPVKFGMTTETRICQALEWQIDDETLDSAIAQTDYGKYSKKLCDLSHIWLFFQEQSLMGIRLPSKGAEWARVEFTTEDIIDAANRVAAQTGIEAAIEAYYTGVPLNDIIR